MNNIELPFIKDMFDTIAPRYDFLNRLLSLRQDVHWRQKMVAALSLPAGSRALDMACGTGDVILEIAKQKGKQIQIVGSDFAPGMLRLAKRKLLAADPTAPIRLIAGNALKMPFQTDSFNAITIAFGIRNIADKRSALTAFHQALKDGGQLAVLELTTPPKGAFRTLYLLYFKKLLPLIGRLVSGDPGAYRYLPESVLNFPESPVFAGIMKSAGFTQVRWQRLTFGIVTLYVGIKSPQKGPA